MIIDNDKLNERLKTVQDELEVTQKELEHLVQHEDVYTESDAAQKCDYLITKIDALTGELESIIDAIN